MADRYRQETVSCRSWLSYLQATGHTKFSDGAQFTVDRDLLPCTAVSAAGKLLESRPGFRTDHELSKI